MPNFSYVIDSSFKPYSFQEMLAPIAMYKDEYEKVEDAYLNLSQKADKFKYLADSLDPDSKAAAIYNGYANELKAQAEDLAKNGLSINNRRALTGLKRRYQGEIRLLDEAKTKLDKELELRRQLGAKDPTLLYADENLNIDKYLGNNRPNLYSVSGSDLFNKGALLGKNVSSRMYKEGDAGSILGGYYRQWVSKQGVGPNEIAGFINSDAVQREVDKILQAEGAKDNLSDANYARARQQVLNGIYNGIVYQESVKPIRDAGVPSWSEKRADERAARAQSVEEAMNGISWVGGKPVYDKNNDLKLQKQLELIKEREAAKAAGKTGSGRSGSGSSYGAINQQSVRVKWKGNNPNDLNEDADDDIEIGPLDKEESYVGNPYNYDDLPQYAKNKVDKIIGDKGDYDNYIYYFKPYKGGFWNDEESALDIVPKKVMRDNIDSEDSDTDFDFSAQ